LDETETYLEGLERKGLRWGRVEMGAFIYMIDRLSCGMDELEDALDSALGDKGEVTGSGTGRAGSNIDLFIRDDAMSQEQALLLIRRALADYGLPGTTRVAIDGREYPLA
jgi:hypothetical protein